MEGDDGTALTEDVKYVNDSLGISSVLGLSTTSVVVGSGAETVEMQRGNVDIGGSLSVGKSLNVSNGAFTVGDESISGARGSFDFSFLNGALSARMFEDNLSYAVGTVSIANNFHFADRVLTATATGVNVNFTHGVFNGLVVQPNSSNLGDGSLTVHGESVFNDTVRVNASSEVNVDNAGVQSFDVNFVEWVNGDNVFEPIFSANRNGVTVHVVNGGNPTFSVSSGKCAFGPNKVDMSMKGAKGDVLCCVNGENEFKPLNIAELSVLAKFPCALVRSLAPSSSDRSQEETLVCDFTEAEYTTPKSLNGFFICAQVWLSESYEGDFRYGTETFRDITHLCSVRVTVEKGQGKFTVNV